MRLYRRRLLRKAKERLARDAMSKPVACRRILSDTSGATAVEFALVAPVFLGFVLFILQISLYHFSQQSLDYATRLAARQIMTGNVASGAQFVGGFKTTLICPRVLWKISCDSVVVNSYKVAKSSNSTDGTGIYQFVNAKTKTLVGPVTDPKQNTFCLGGPGDYIFLDVSYKFPDFTGGLLGLLTDSFILRSATFFYNEPTIGNSSC